ncbi:MAG: hypothetical protein Q7R76_00400 [Candidatus Woesearchaeota archaeon]|nr:hypothetical protein [Candidatus Woesearchaeota archaeon]
MVFKGVRDWYMRRQGMTPFDPQELETMLGREFYLVVMGTAARERMLRRFDGKLAEVPSGSVLEIKSRDHSRVDGYVIGSIAKAEYDDGRAVGDDISAVQKSFVLTLDGVDLSQPAKPILSGRTQEHGLLDNSLAPNWAPMTVHLCDVVEYKSLGSVATGAQLFGR